MENEKELQREILPIVHRAGELAVSNVEEYEFASGFLKEIKDAQKKVKDFFEPMKKKAHEAWKAITGKEAETLKPLDNAERTIKGKMLYYRQEEEKKRREEERRLQAEADARAERERQRLIKEAEKLKTLELKEQRLQQASEVEAPTVIVQSEAPKISGQSIRKIWKARIIDIEKLPRQWMLPNEKALNDFARSTKGKMPIEGVEFYEEEILASGGR